MHKLYLISLSVFFLDILSKNFIQNKMIYGEQVEITSFLSLVHFQNTGAAFSFLSDQGGWQRYFLIVISLLAVLYIPWLINQYKKNILIVIGLLLILGGAIGNLYDRISYGYVIDFIYFHFAEFYWPAFNVADSAISIGVLLFLYGSFKNYKKI
ncbi:signal peptidase II [Methylophilaceae bacterium]|nr:signal peptidase II [Methylophilaceae bacterium]